jgi:allophanate hydrolase subunit 2
LVRVLPGPQIDWFERGALHTLQSQPYRVTTASNRMGFHLEGPAVAAVRAGDMISDTTPLGALQVPGSGEPILLMADRQTTGGYPQIATVIGADIGIAGQLAPGDTISFRVCSIEEAWEARRRQEQALQEIERQTPS